MVEFQCKFCYQKFRSVASQTPAAPDGSHYSQWRPLGTAVSVRQGIRHNLFPFFQTFNDSVDVPLATYFLTMGLCSAFLLDLIGHWAWRDAAARCVGHLARQLSDDRQGSCTRPMIPAGHQTVASVTVPPSRPQSVASSLHAQWQIRRREPQPPPPQ